MDHFSVISNLLDENRIRKVQYQDVTYFNLVDVFAVFLNTDRKHAQNYYHVFKGRLRDNNGVLPRIIKLKAQARDMKFYLTDFTNAEGIELVCSQIEGSINRRKIRLEYRQDDEVENFHPQVLSLLKERGWQTQHHVRLQSGHIIDIVAVLDNITYVIECKPHLTNSKLYTAIGQVLCYVQEYNRNAVPTLATYSDQVGNYEIDCCNSTNIKLIMI